MPDECWGAWEQITARNQGAPPSDEQLVGAIGACQTTFAWIQVTTADFIEIGIPPDQLDQAVIEVCLADEDGAGQIFELTLCTDLVLM